MDRKLGVASGEWKAVVMDNHDLERPNRLRPDEELAQDAPPVSEIRYLTLEEQGVMSRALLASVTIVEDPCPIPGPPGSANQDG